MTDLSNIPAFLVRKPGDTKLAREFRSETEEPSTVRGMSAKANTPPLGLLPSAIPLTIACGPPGSGRKMYVLERTTSRDRIIDLDAVAARLSGAKLYGAGEEWHERAVEERDRLLRSLRDERRDRAFLTLDAPSAKCRELWDRALRPQQIVVLETPINACLGRLAADPLRSPALDHLEADVRAWWATYAPRDGETVIRGKHLEVSA